MSSSPDAHGARRFDALRASAPGVLVALPLLFVLPRALHRASWATLGRDQGIFQYVAWAVAQGDQAYRDVRDVNGPLVPLLHLVLAWLGGDDEHRFRVLDLVITGLTAALAGASFWTLAPATAASSRRFRWARGAASALAAWGVVSAQYLAYGFWDSAQRESFFDWFLLASIGCFFLASQALAERRSRRGILLLAASGACSGMPWLGKPTYALFTFAALFVLLLDRQSLSRLGRVFVFAVGGAVGSLVPVLFLLARGDVGAWMRISFNDVPAMYRFIWPRTASDILFGDLASLTWLALASSGGVVLFVVLRRLPVRALLLAATPLCGLVSVVVQAKGFVYHFHPVTVGSALALVALVLGAWDWAESRSSFALRSAATVIASALALVLGWRMSLLAWRAPYPPAPESREEAETAERLAFYERVDFFPTALRDAAAFVDANTREDERVQTYGMDPYLLFLARRKSATPYIYAYDLNADAALVGSFDPQGVHPTPAQTDVIRAMRDAHEQDMLDRLKKSPPPAFVFIGRSPLMSFADAVRDFETHCPVAAAWVESNYVEMADFEGIRVWLRRDRAARARPR